MSRIAVVGSGSVGGNLVRRLTTLGHEVVLGARDETSASVRELTRELPSVAVAGVSEAAARADIVVLAVPAGQVEAALGAVLAQRSPSDELTVVDATNDVAPGSSSPYERIVDAVPAGSAVVVVKAFNTVGAEVILDPRAGGQRVFLPIAGPDSAATAVRDLAESIGFDALVIGGAEAVHHLEAHARFWIHLALVRGLGRDFAFVRLDRSPPVAAGSSDP